MRDGRAAEREEARAARQFQLQHAVTPSQVAELKPVPLKLLPLRDRDDVTAYLSRFERVAGLPQDRSLTNYSTLDDATTDSYELLNIALLKAFKLDEKHYRREFRYARLDPNSNFEQFSTDLKRKFY